MKNCFIVCEYNPFHYGHEYLIKKIKEMGYNVICLMSGNFTQRGEFAILSKYERAKAAVIGGADLVLELPYPYSCSSANCFTSSSIELISNLDKDFTIAFGSENGNIKDIEKVANNLMSDELNNKVNELTKRGVRYSKAINDVYQELFESTELFGNSNDILNILYVKSMKKLGYKNEVLAIKRVGKLYNEDGLDSYSSARYIRQLINDNHIDELEKCMPKYSFEILKENIKYLPDKESFDKYMKLYNSMNKIDNPEEIFEVNKELYNRILKYDDDVSNKIYSLSKVNRAKIHILTKTNSSNVSYPMFTQLLACNENGRNILKSMKKTSNIPIITKQADYQKYDEIQKQYEINMMADKIYLLFVNRVEDKDLFMRIKPYIL